MWFADELSVHRRLVPSLLERLRLAHGEMTVEATPRRLAVIVRSVDCLQSSIEEKIRGPPAKVLPQCLHLVYTHSLGCKILIKLVS